jgi:hypothetical protein
MSIVLFYALYIVVYLLVLALAAYFIGFLIAFGLQIKYLEYDQELRDTFTPSGVNLEPAWLCTRRSFKSWRQVALILEAREARNDHQPS